MNASWKTLAGAGLTAVLLAACGGGGGGDSGTAAAQTGTLKVSMTDAPSCGYNNVYVTVTKIRVNASASAGDNDAGWYDVNVANPQKIDLLSLSNGVLADLGQTALPAGQYQQVRLVLAQNTGNTLSNSVVPTGGSEQALATPSATQSGYKINGPFTVQANTLVDLVLDFNACKSIVQHGNGSYALKPVVSATPMVVSGAIDGYVAANDVGATVYAEQNGQVVKGTVTDNTGHFVLSPLVQSSTQGNYDVVIVKTGETTGIVRAVPVSVNATTALSTSQAPISLDASASNPVSGTVTASADAAVRSLQSVNSASYEIAATNANLDTGAYSMTLSTAAPMIGTYAGSLPVALAAAPAAAGQYQVEADAANGATQSAAVNLSAGAQSNVNFSF
ncbi:MAG: DUF4382 domain-containing protein [Paraburkholderia sp.]|jgi:hypothetical protein|nr:DUF4382 domain-containing protein [Paraburkholderia sp.]